MPTYLAIETSCDETGIAIIKNGKLISNKVASQLEIHRKWGGVVPEIASRHHLEILPVLLKEAFKEAGLSLENPDLTGIGVTAGPGLLGSLLVGVVFARTLSWKWKIPLYPVNHLEAHIFANFIEHGPLNYPFVALVVSGGHTLIVHSPNPGEYKLFSSTIDDAAGEAMDKVARFANLGYPGGPIIDELSKKGKTVYNFPKALAGNLDFSFSGLKTHVIRFLQKNPNVKVEDFAASFQEAIVQSIVYRTVQVCKLTKAKYFYGAGGVMANSRLRQALKEALEKLSVEFFYPSPEYCTDNAAMVAALLHCGTWLKEKFEFEPNSTWEIGEPL